MVATTEQVEEKKEVASEQVEENKEVAAVDAEEKKEVHEEMDVDAKAGNAEKLIPKKPEQPKELEEDAPADDRPKLAETPAFGLSATDSTMNVMPTANGKLLKSLGDGGLQHLLAGARCNVGIKSGRYMFESRIVESFNEQSSNSQQARKAVARLGFSTAGSSLFLADSIENICFDMEGAFVHAGSKTKISAPLTCGDTVAVLLNLDESSPNANTVSFFKNGKRAGAPQAVPDNLRGKTLFPTIAFKNVTVQVNFSSQPRVPLPFVCRMVQDAAEGDVEITRDLHVGEKCEVMFPVGLPDEGAFDWLDSFLQKNPHFTELSHRSIIDWAQKSGVWRKKGYGWRSCNDTPDMGFGIPVLDDLSAQRILDYVAPSLQRNFVVMGLKSNLIAAQRKKELDRFPSSDFRRVATVVMGVPDAEYKTGIQERMIKEKQAKTTAEKNKKSAEQERQRLFTERKRKVEDAKKARLKAIQKKKAGLDEDSESEEKGDEEDKPEEAMNSEGDVAIELTEEEKNLTHRKLAAKDLSEGSLAKCFGSFSLPEKAEGFDDVRYVWQNEADCVSYFEKWLMNMKRTQRAEGLEPSAWFKDQYAAWNKALNDWKKRQTEWKEPSRRKQLLTKLKTEIAKKSAEGDVEEGGEKKEAQDIELPEVDMEDLDITDVEDIMNVGSGEPLFANFAYEDWTLLSLRFELHLLVYAFRKDLDDPDRQRFSQEHFPYYFNKYFNKNFFIKSFGFAELASLIEVIDSTASLENSMLDAVLPEDAPIERFVKICEEHRRERVRRSDAGDETAELKFTRPSPVPRGLQAGGRPGPNGLGSVAGGSKRPYAAPPSSYPPAQRQRTAYGSPPAAYGSVYARTGYGAVYRR